MNAADGPGRGQSRTRGRPGRTRGGPRRRLWPQFVAPALILAILAVTSVVGPGPGVEPLQAQTLFGGGDEEAIPVLLVPGWGDQAPDLEPLRLHLIEEGWPETRIAALSFPDPFGSNQSNAREIDRAVDALRAMTGAPRVDIVAHSMGGLAVRYFLLVRPDVDEAVRRAVFLGTPHRGTVAAILAWGDGGREMVPGSDFLTQLNEGESGVPTGVEALAIRTPVDLRVIPGSSGLLPGALNLEICCPTHNQLVEEERTLGAVVNFLRHGAEGVPDAERPGQRAEWSGSALQAFEPWNPWGDGWMERMVRKWLLPL
ncbi:MAG: hypothetical protein EA422_12220, partial [Gemmatimonadales bacterium]